jgi:hypothetical protein
MWVGMWMAVTAVAQDEPAEEIVVWGDLFARWDDTRWLVATEITTPLTFTLKKDENAEFATQEILVRSVIACSKDWKLGPKRYEVGCKLEDISLKAAVAERRVNEADVARAQSVLDEIDVKLTGALLQLQVADDGRVTALSLDGIDTSTSRERTIQETMRQILSRQVVGFNLKLRKYNQLNEGKWQEYNSSIMSMPMPDGTPSGSNLVVHYLNRFRGELIVQSIGKGVSAVPLVPPRNYELELIGVSRFDPNEGFMLERVWALTGKESAGSFLTHGGDYFSAGRILMLGETDRPDLGTTQVVNGKNQSVANLPAWVSIEG